MSRRQLRLRSEITFWLQEAVKLDLKLLICKDEVDWTLLSNGNYHPLSLSLTQFSLNFYFHLNFYSAYSSSLSTSHSCDVVSLTYMQPLLALIWNVSHSLPLKSDDCEVIISLVDHNVNKEIESFGRVVQIVDHHQEVASVVTSEDGNTDQLDKEIVPGVGSCCSLVTKRYLNFLQTSSSEDNEHFDSHVQIALLLYGPVILGKCLFPSLPFLSPSSSSHASCFSILTLASSFFSKLLSVFSSPFISSYSSAPESPLCQKWAEKENKKKKGERERETVSLVMSLNALERSMSLFSYSYSKLHI